MTVEGYKHFIDAESMSAFDVNAFLMSQAVTRFDTAADRDAALEQVVTEGMVSYNKDTGELQLYDGSAWQTVGSISGVVTDHGALTGLGDDDHPQYLTEARGDLRYADIASSPTITLSGDASGSVTLTNLGSGTLTVTVADDSHNHTIANVDNLQTTLDGKAASSHSHAYLPTAGGTVTGNVTVNSVIYTNEIADRTGTQLVIGAGESQGKHTGMTGEAVYITGESGLQIRTPDSGHTNYQSGWTERSVGIAHGKLTFPDYVETKIQLYSGYYIGIEGSTMAFTSGRYFKFYENGDSGVKVQIDTNTHGIITCYADTTTADYITIYADTSWSRIHASQQIYINNWIHPDPGVRCYDDGTAAAPVLSFRTDTDTGIYRNTTNQLALNAGGSAGIVVASGTCITAAPSTSSTSGYQYVLRNNTYGTLYRYTSTIELKEQVADFDGSGDLIDALRPVTFIPKFIAGQPTPDDQDDEFDPTVETDAQRQMREADLQYGFIAEEVATVGDGKLAQYEWTEDGQLKATGWKWPDMIAVLVAEVKSLRARVTTLETT